MVRMMRTNHRIGARIKPKWGKIGAPRSAKRMAWLRKIRKKGKNWSATLGKTKGVLIRKKRR